MGLDDLLALRGWVRRVRRRATAQPNASLIQRRQGWGLEFSGLRAYQNGDDVRHLDWRVYARSGAAHTRLYYPESSHFCTLSVSQTRSMQFGSAHQTKAVFAARLAAALAWYFSASEALVNFGHGHQRSVATALKKWSNNPPVPWLQQPKQGSHFVFADFSNELLAQLPAQAHRKVSPTWVWIVDPMEEKLPAPTLPFQVRTLAGRSMAWLSKDQANQAFLKREARLQTMARDARATVVRLSTDLPLGKALYQLVEGAHA